MSLAELTPRDLELIRRRGSAPEAVERQLALYADPPAPTRVLRPCTVGDGIRRLAREEVEAFATLLGERSPGLDIVKFVPASGAASRMFRALLAVSAAGAADRAELAERASRGDADAVAALEIVDRVDELAVRDDLAAELARRGTTLADASPQTLLRALLDDDGLGYASLPKGLLAFHRDGDAVRTPLEEHLFEAAGYAVGRGGIARLHFTVSPEHRAGFQELVARVLPEYERRFDVRFDVEFSVQKPSTDSLAVTPQGRPFRDEQGRLLFRPAGHGALVENLAEIDADLVYVKNIDNVAPERRAAQGILWKRALGGLLVSVRDEVFEALDALEGRDGVDHALDLVARRFGMRPPDGTDAAAWARERLERPIRVCGMVVNEGEPGGGPFWVVDPDGGPATAQIVETSQIDTDDPAQKAVLEAATHFNPVDLVCAPRRRDGDLFDLSRFVDPRQVFLAHKSHGGRPLVSLELPGLWNGAMAGWNTVFVEVPAETFQPVKTLNDLLRDAHRPRD